MSTNQTEKLRLTAQFMVFLLVSISFVFYRLYINGKINFKLIGLNGLSPFGGLNMLYDWLAVPGYQLHPDSPALLLAAAIIILGLVAGRFLCGWICPFGAISDYCSLAGKKLLGKNYELPKALDAPLRNLKYLVLIFIIGSKLFTGTCVLKDLGPWLAYANLPGLPGTFKEIPLAFVVLILVLLGAFFISRFYCRYLCPLGAIQAILSGTGFTQLKKERGQTFSCSSCRVCSYDCCPVNIKPGGAEIVDSMECISCLRCVGASCPGETKTFKVVFFKRPLKNTLYMLVAYAIFLGIYAGVGLNSYITEDQSKGLALTPRETYRDGVYYGTGAGFAPGINVQVEIKEGRIDSIIVLKHFETSGYYEEAFKETTRRITKTQKAAVDAVSGATYSSRGLAEAVQDALDKAKI